MGEWTGYCSHESGLECPNCRTYYVIQDKSNKPSLTYAHLLLLETWIGRLPESPEEREEVIGLKQFVQTWKQQFKMMTE